MCRHYSFLYVALPIVPAAVGCAPPHGVSAFARGAGRRARRPSRADVPGGPLRPHPGRLRRHRPVRPRARPHLGCSQGPRHHPTTPPPPPDLTPFASEPPPNRRPLFPG